MLLHILNIIAPVFLVIAAGFMTVRRGYFADHMVDGLMKFAILFAVPSLLFQATSTLDLSTAYDWRIMLAFYTAAAVSFASASLLAYWRFKKHPGESIAIGFGALFSNSVLLGLPISERAWGVDNMSTVYTIISIHAPFCYLLGITSMEVLRTDGRSWPETTSVIVKAMFKNSLMIGIGLGFMVNLSGMVMPTIVTSAIEIISNAALPVALFGLGGILTRYKFSHSLGEVGTVSVFSLFIHPALTWLICDLLLVDQAISRTAVLIAAMAPGINSYLFASMYQRGQGIAASVVLLATAMSVISVSGWLWALN
ncbi:MAG: AEC family transporter [Gammaproteobacteria bacterium]|nr:AEC family transporter [Gammaproteobacteria bacterium]